MAAEQSLKPDQLSWHHTTADTLMRPIMHTLGGFRTDVLQETHPWHVQIIDPTLVDPELSVTIKGNPQETLQSHALFLFHAPIFGGWKSYTLFEAAQAEFHIGWVARIQEKIAQAAIHRLKISDGQVRMLNGTGDSETEFFAVDPEGNQIGLGIAGQGTLGDNQFPGTRLL